MQSSMKGTVWYCTCSQVNTCVPATSTDRGTNMVASRGNAQRQRSLYIFLFPQISRKSLHNNHQNYMKMKEEVFGLGQYINDPKKPSVAPPCQKKPTASNELSSSCCSVSSFSSPSSVEDPFVYDAHSCSITGRLSNILNDYIIFNTVLGSGCCGTVRECLHHRTNQFFAVKSIRKAKIHRQDHLRREINILSSVHHPSIIRTVDCYEDEDYVHIVTEKCWGGDLFDLIEQRSDKGCFNERSTARIIKSLLEAVAYLHANGIVHRDIKPENILLETQDEDSPIRLADFGLARRHLHGIDQNMSKFRGTVYYMSPELLECNYSSPSDVWSIGVVAYILLSGYPPFNGDTDPEIYSAIFKGQLDFPEQTGWLEKSSQCIDFIKCLLQKDPRRRFSAQQALFHPWIVEMTQQTQENEVQAQENEVSLTEGFKTKKRKHPESATQPPRTSHSRRVSA